MDKNMFYKIVDEAVESSVSKISCLRGVKPIVHPDIIDSPFYAN
ncbi:hypothetical protein [Staphylothermus hellenicus]|nr:hypothetical protein [Staphylothermus hellenicus]